MPGFFGFFWGVVRSEEFVEFWHLQLGVPFYGLLVWSWGSAGLLFLVDCKIFDSF